MSKVAVYPGSFDPITVGHLDIIQRVASIFDRVIVLVANASDKQYMFGIRERHDFVKEALKSLPNVEVHVHDGLTTDFMRKNKAQVIVRGLRAIADFEYEGTLANMNHRLAPEIETFMIFSRPEFYYISSRGVKEIVKNGGAITGLVPAEVEAVMVKRVKGT